MRSERCLEELSYALSLLLRGKALDQANTWLAQAKGKVPAPNQTQLD